jgi:hypothetical protein
VSTPITNAVALLLALRPYQPTVRDGALEFDIEPPAELDGLLCVLHTGVRALLSGNPWYAERSDKPRVRQLEPDSLLPDKTTLLCVSGDQRWDRLKPDAAIDHPELFEHPGEKPKRKRKVAA